MLGERIALLRRQAGLSQRALAAALEVSPSTVGMYEQKRRVPSTELLVKMARLFEVSTDFLLTGRAGQRDSAALNALLTRTMTELRTESAPLTREEAAILLSGLLSAGELTEEEKWAMIEKKGDRKMTDEEYMREALLLAREAAQEGEVPVGCVVVCEGKIVGRGRNRREKEKNALCHAELEAIDQACRTLGGWRLWQCTLYVTLEPCPMCAGAAINARIPRVVYGASDEKAGSCGTLTDLFLLPYNHRPEVTSGVLEEESRALLQEFFRKLRITPRVKVWNRPKAEK